MTNFKVGDHVIEKSTGKIIELTCYFLTSDTWVCKGSTIFAVAATKLQADSILIPELWIRQTLHDSRGINYSVDSFDYDTGFIQIKTLDGFGRRSVVPMIPRTFQEYAFEKPAPISNPLLKLCPKQESGAYYPVPILKRPCQCGSHMPKGQNHGYWCPEFSKEF